MLAIALALGSSLAWGVSDFLGGQKSRTVALLAVLLISQAAALIILAAIVAASGDPPPDGSFLLFAALAGISEAIGVAALYRGLAVGVMSIVAPAAATAPMVPLVAGVAGGEVPGPVQIVGIGLAIVGIGVTVCRRHPQGTPNTAVVRSIGFGLLCALGFGGFYVAMDAASEGEIPWALLVARATAVSTFAAAAVVTRASVAVDRRDLIVIVSIGALVIAADAMYATASTQGVLGVVAALSTLYLMLTIVLAECRTRKGTRWTTGAMMAPTRRTGRASPTPSSS